MSWISIENMWNKSKTVVLPDLGEKSYVIQLIEKAGQFLEKSGNLSIL